MPSTGTTTGACRPSLSTHMIQSLWSVAAGPISCSTRASTSASIISGGASAKFVMRPG